MPILLNKTLRLFLDSIGRRDEYEFYLERFKAGSSSAFAILCPERNGLDDTSSVFSFDLEFLIRLGLTPIILLCGSDAEDMRDRLLKEDHPFAPLPLTLNPANKKRTCEMVAEYHKECRQHGKAMVLVSPSSLEDGLTSLVPTISERVHYIRMRGPLHNKKDEPISFFCVAKQNFNELAQEDIPIAELAEKLLTYNPGLHFSVASPLSLLEELFTVKGAGCLIRRCSAILHFTSMHEVNTDLLCDLLEDSFKKPLCNQNFLKKASEIYMEENYRGAALLENHAAGVYISKFAVRTLARGEGVANEIWKEILTKHKAVFWRSNINNRINHWYERKAEGYQTEGKWKVFWMGVSRDRIPDVIRYAIERDEDFETT